MFSSTQNKTRLPTSLLAVSVVALLVWWLWSQNESIAPISMAADNGLAPASSIRPVADAEDISGQAQSTPASSLTGEQDADLKLRFQQAMDYIENQQRDQAVETFTGLIVDYPLVPELYVNLAALYAQSGELDQARQLLTQGLEQHHKSQALFASLKIVHGALAANAYQKALDATSPDLAPGEVSLPMMEQLTTNVDSDLTIAELRARLDDKQQSEPDSNNKLRQRIARLQLELAESEQRVDGLKLVHLTEIEQLQRQLAEQSEALLVSQAAEREALARVVRTEESARTELSDAVAKLEEEKRVIVAQKDAVIERQQQGAERVRAMVEPPVDVTTEKQRESTADDSKDQQ